MSSMRDELKAVRACGMKLHNRRVDGKLLRDGSILWRFKCLDGRIIRTERIRLSLEALVAMMRIADELTREGGK